LYFFFSGEANLGGPNDCKPTHRYTALKNPVGRLEATGPSHRLDV